MAPLVVSVGSINLDLQLRTDRSPSPGETLVGRDFVMLGGGKAANVAYLARNLGVDACLVARLGDDDLGERAIAPVAEVGVDLAHTTRAAGSSTGVAMIAVPPDGHKTILMAANANDGWTPDEVDEATEAVAGAPEGSIVVLDLEVSPDLVRRVVEASHARGLPLVVDPSPAARFPGDLYPAVDYVAPNQAEAGHLTGDEVTSIDDAFRAADRLTARGAGTAVVRLADGGGAIVGGGVRERIGQFDARTVDATGAGDAFIGAFAVGLLEGRAVVDAARLGSAAAAITVGRYGSQPAYPTRSELEEMLGRTASQ